MDTDNLNQNLDEGIVDRIKLAIGKEPSEKIGGFLEKASKKISKGGKKVSDVVTKLTKKVGTGVAAIAQSIQAPPDPSVGSWFDPQAATADFIKRVNARNAPINYRASSYGHVPSHSLVDNVNYVLKQKPNESINVELAKKFGKNFDMWAPDVEAERAKLMKKFFPKSEQTRAANLSLGEIARNIGYVSAGEHLAMGEDKDETVRKTAKKLKIPASGAFSHDMVLKYTEGDFKPQEPAELLAYRTWHAGQKGTTAPKPEELFHHGTFHVAPEFEADWVPEQLRKTNRANRKAWEAAVKASQGHMTKSPDKVKEVPVKSVFENKEYNPLLGRTKQVYGMRYGGFPRQLNG